MKLEYHHTHAGGGTERKVEEQQQKQQKQQGSSRAIIQQQQCSNACKARVSRVFSGLACMGCVASSCSFWVVVFQFTILWGTLFVFLDIFQSCTEKKNLERKKERKNHVQKRIPGGTWYEKKKISYYC